MDGSSLGVLTAIGATIAKVAVALFVLVNGAFIALVVMRRDRGLVNRWTKRLVVADTALLLAAGGAPVAAWAARTAARAVIAVLPGTPNVSPVDADAAPVTVEPANGVR